MLSPNGVFSSYGGWWLHRPLKQGFFPYGWMILEMNWASQCLWINFLLRQEEASFEFSHRNETRVFDFNFGHTSRRVQHRIDERHSLQFVGHRSEFFSQDFHQRASHSVSRHTDQSYPVIGHHSSSGPIIKRPRSSRHISEHHSSSHNENFVRHTSDVHSSHHRHHSRERDPALPKSITCLYCDRRFRPGEETARDSIKDYCLGFSNTSCF